MVPHSGWGNISSFLYFDHHKSWKCFLTFSLFTAALPFTHHCHFSSSTFLLHLPPTVSLPRHLSHSCLLLLSVFFLFLLSPALTLNLSLGCSNFPLITFSLFHLAIPTPQTSFPPPSLAILSPFFSTILSSLSHPSLLLTFHPPPTPSSPPGLAAVCGNAFWPLPPHTQTHTKFNVGQNRDETKERMNKTVELMAMVTAPGGPTLLIYYAGWAFKSRYSPSSLLTASLRSTLQWERESSDREIEMEMEREERWETGGKEQKTMSEDLLEIGRRQSAPQNPNT